MVGSRNSPKPRLHVHLLLRRQNEGDGGGDAHGWAWRGLRRNGSTGRHIFWEMLIKDSHPVLSLIIQGNNFEGLIDTGADISIISSQQWPQDWEKKKKSPLMLTRLGSIADV